MRVRPPKPVVTYAIAGICAVVYAFQWLMPAVTEAGDFYPLGGYVEPWRFLTSVFLHSPTSATHLLFNLMGLYVMGQFLEPFLGRARFVALYLLVRLMGKRELGQMTPFELIVLVAGNTDEQSPGARDRPPARSPTNSGSTAG